MLDDEIRSFFEEARDHEENRVKWPEVSSTIFPGFVRGLQADFKDSRRLLRKTLDDVETTVVGLYERGAETPAMIDLIDEVVAVIRRKDEAPDTRFQEILQLLGKWGVPIIQS